MSGATQLFSASTKGQKQNPEPNPRRWSGLLRNFKSQLKKAPIERDIDRPAHPQAGSGRQGRNSFIGSLKLPGLSAPSFLFPSSSPASEKKVNPVASLFRGYFRHERRRSSSQQERRRASNPDDDEEEQETFDSACRSLCMMGINEPSTYEAFRECCNTGNQEDSADDVFQQFCAMNLDGMTTKGTIQEGHTGEGLIPGDAKDVKTAARASPTPEKGLSKHNN